MYFPTNLPQDGTSGDTKARPMVSTLTEADQKAYELELDSDRCRSKPCQIGKQAQGELIHQTFFRGEERHIPMIECTDFLQSYGSFPTLA
jgi:hypothetical protein